MSKLIKTLLLTAALFAGFAALTWSLSKDKVPYFGNTMVLDQKEITAISPVGPFGGSFLLSQKMDMGHINFRDDFLDRPICLSLFLDKNFPHFKHVPFKLALVGDNLNVVKVLSTAVIKDDFGRICFDDTTLGQLKDQQVSIQISAESPSQTNIARVIMTPHKKGPPAEIDGVASNLSLPFTLEVQQPISRHQWMSFAVINLIVSLMVSIVFVQSFSRNRS
ncbi:hypothetical protein [Hydrogenophaga taeniospiralis]|uniref:hypothetical protein n=1 Tax=Hydrogenophaga taeniospiralis TaxID=65656 RepID=UPI001CFBCD36|nr:hypothetical protein [Hydrogenophaga taeniospiralis]UCU95921.1 hypothetical protein KI616_08810 [Hydrogenophaga taeniospiralis]